MEKALNLNSSEILKKKFTADVKGYSAIEVDRYLDLIIEDYKRFGKEIERLNSELSSLRNSSASLCSDKDSLSKAYASLLEQHNRLKADNAELRGRLEGIRPGDNVTAENIDYIKRVRQLEKFLHDEGYNIADLKTKQQ